MIMKLSEKSWLEKMVILKQQALKLRTRCGLWLVILVGLFVLPMFALTQARLPGGIVYVSQRGEDPDIWVMQTDGSGQTPLLAGPELDHWPSFSPDRARIVFTRSVTLPSEDLHGNLHIMELDSGTIRQLTSDGDIHQPAWSPSGDRIAFDAFKGPLQMINTDGSGRQVVVFDTFADRPAWTPDGRDLIYHLLNGTGQGSRGLFRYDGFLLFSTQIVDFGFDPAVSPDGQKIAFTSDIDGDFDIYVINTDGSGLVNLTAGFDANDFSPVWSPDGNYIAFATARDGNVEIYRMQADGSEQTNLTNAPNSDEFNPDWK